MSMESSRTLMRIKGRKKVKYQLEEGSNLKGLIWRLFLKRCKRVYKLVFIG